MLSRGWNGTRVVTVPCHTCQLAMSAGNEYDELRVERAIDQYIEGWFAGTIPDEVLTHQINAEREAKERKTQQQQGGRLWKHG